MKNFSYFAGLVVLASLSLIPIQVTHAAGLAPSFPSFMPVPTVPSRMVSIPKFTDSQTRSLSTFLENLKLPSSSLSDFLALLKESSCTIGSASSGTGTSGNGTSHAITFSADTNNHWQFTAGYNNGPEVMAYDHPDGDAAFGLAGDPADTDIPLTSAVEAVVVNSGGRYLSDTCSGKILYTGNPANDFACYIQEATAQGYVYVTGTHAGTNN